ncbi:MAG TPA: hypothetical protein DHU96_12900 [Actinobacteria bacterium]|nr:hypothetical protein [Actinomycetota bacterium]
MANPTDPRPEPFRAQLDDGQIVETDGSTVTDPASGSPVPAVLLRMSRTRAHTLAHLLDDWCRVARVYATLRSSEVTERALVWALEASAAATGDPEATRCALSGPQAPSVAQRLAAAAVLSEREHRINPVQRIAIVDAAARWLAEDAGEDLAEALLQAVCSDPVTANFVYLALIEQPEPAP